MKIVVNSYTWDSGKWGNNVKVGDLATLPNNRNSTKPWKGRVTSLTSPYTGPLKTILGLRRKGSFVAHEVKQPPFYTKPLTASDKPSAQVAPAPVTLTFDPASGAMDMLEKIRGAKSIVVGGTVYVKDAWDMWFKVDSLFA